MKAIVSIYDDNDRPIRENWLVEAVDERLERDPKTRAVIQKTLFRFYVSTILDHGISEEERQQKKKSLETMTDEEFQASLERAKMRCRICGKVLDMNDSGRPADNGCCSICQELVDREEQKK